MNNYLAQIFKDDELISKIKKRLPYFYQLAEQECSRAGKLGMEIGSLREKIIIALLIYKYSETNVETNIPITGAEVDAKLFGQPISIKTTTGKGLSGVKLIWTVDPKKAKEFLDNYNPHCDMILVQIIWNGLGGFYYIPLEVQQKVFNEMGRGKYIKLPKPGTNPRGVEVNKEALWSLVHSQDTLGITIEWQRSNIDYQPYKRWVDYWSE